MPRVRGLTNYQKADDQILKCIEFIEGRRKTKHINQTQLARELKLQQPQICKKLNLQQDITLKEFIMICQTLEASDEDIVRMVRIR